MHARGSIIKRYPRLTKLLVSLVLFFVFLVVTELGFRVIRYLVKGPDIARALTTDDAELGWHLNTHRERTTSTNSCGEIVVVESYDHPYLVKRPRFQNDTRVLFLGDSFTQAHEVSSGRAYFDVFEELTQNRYSVFAAGIGGFGSLQEYLLLRRVSDEVRPDVVIWQLHRNDVSNNVFALEHGSFYNNQRRRPYLDLRAGQVYFEDPGFFLFDVSYLFRFLFYRMLALDWTYDLGLLDAANSLIAPPEEDLPGLTRQGLDVLRTVLHRAIEEHPGTQFFGFAADQQYDREYKQVFEGEGAAYFAGVSRLVARESRPTNCLPLDEHWNHYGNEVAGRLLKEMLDRTLSSDLDALSAQVPDQLTRSSS
jgi:hypothetical protein